MEHHTPAAVDDIPSVTAVDRGSEFVANAGDVELTVNAEAKSESQSPELSFALLACPVAHQPVPKWSAVRSSIVSALAYMVARNCEAEMLESTACKRPRLIASPLVQAGR